MLLVHTSPTLTPHTYTVTTRSLGSSSSFTEGTSGSGIQSLHSASISCKQSYQHRHKCCCDLSLAVRHSSFCSLVQVNLNARGAVVIRRELEVRCSQTAASPSLTPPFAFCPAPTPYTHAFFPVSPPCPPPSSCPGLEAVLKVLNKGDTHLLRICCTPLLRPPCFLSSSFLSLLRTLSVRGASALGRGLKLC